MYAYFAVLSIMIVIFYGLKYATVTHKNYQIRNLSDDYFYECGINYTLTGLLAFGIIFFKDCLFIKTNIPDLKTIIVYLLFVDAIQYWVHRITHKTPILRKILHEKHHDVFHLLPMDAFNLTFIEHCIYVFISSILPLFVFSINIYDYFFILIVMFIHSVYIHWQTDEGFIFPMFITSEYHRQHHQIGRGNYCPLFPIWDEYMKSRIDTRKQPDNKEVK